MKENIKSGMILGSLFAGTLVSLAFLIYVMVGFVDWLSQDPLDLIKDTEFPQYVESADFQLCRDKGGIPIRSEWNSSLSRCDLLDK